ncbi:MAG TPA: hypothetical protein VM536_22260, partial [Chloroflexia bacterium]|nr:hypothetical protein [Chloroflexia bacterium]
DRRRVIIRTIPEREAAVQEPFAGVARATQDLLAQYDAAQLTMIRDFIVAANRVGRAEIARIREQSPRAARRPRAGRASAE